MEHRLPPHEPRRLQLSDSERVLQLPGAEANRKLSMLIKRLTERGSDDHFAFPSGHPTMVVDDDDDISGVGVTVTEKVTRDLALFGDTARAALTNLIAASACTTTVMTTFLCLGWLRDELEEAEWTVEQDQVYSLVPAESDELGPLTLWHFTRLESFAEMMQALGIQPPNVVMGRLYWHITPVTTGAELREFQRQITTVMDHPRPLPMSDAADATFFGNWVAGDREMWFLTESQDSVVDEGRRLVQVAMGLA
eukprot:COSAG01_NODE_41_length_32446_cov_41.218877_3_plen_252_part_00